MKRKVFVGISGGVDSAVSAYLLKEKGFDVTGVFMKNWSGEEYGLEDNCPWKEDYENAKKVTEHLSIPLKVYNFEKEYRSLVIEDFFTQYSLGNTPNPDILCNKYIKFDKFLNKALDDGADYIATGHYANTHSGKLFKAKDESKDQTYFLSQLNNAQLERSIFPLGKLLKSEVRVIARDIGLPNAERKDSQGICFIGRVDIKDFLRQRLVEKVGDIIDYDSNKVVGSHIGVWFYTIGQREGLRIGGSGEPYFVSSKDVENNILYVVKGKDNPSLWNSKFIVNDFNWISGKPTETLNRSISAVIRYRAKTTPVNVSFLDNNRLEFTFSDRQWAGTTGQSIVLYNENECLGGGSIYTVVD